MKKIFWNVDTANDMMKPDGALYVPDAKEIIENVSKLSEFAYERNIKEIRTADLHDENTLEISTVPDFVETFPDHCMRETWGAEFAMPILGKAYVIDWKMKTYDSESVLNTRTIVLYKDKFDVFTGTSHVENVLKNISPENIIVYGVATNFCVADVAEGLAKRGYGVSVVMDAVKEIPVDKGPRSLVETFGRWDALGVKRISLEEVLR